MNLKAAKCKATGTATIDLPSNRKCHQSVEMYRSVERGYGNYWCRNMSGYIVIPALRKGANFPKVSGRNLCQ